MSTANDFQKQEKRQKHDVVQRIGDWEYVGGSGIWQEWKNVKTGESSMKSYTMQKSSRFDTCDHYWELIDPNGNIQCQKCELGSHIPWGIKFVKDGKIVEKL